MSSPSSTAAIQTPMRAKLGCWWHERLDTERVLHRSWIPLQKKSWLDLCNRTEQLLRDDRTGGRVCQWSDSSSLTVTKTFPDLGRRLFQYAAKQWPILLDTPNLVRTDNPDVSVIIAIGGIDRLNQFQLSLRSVLCQRDVSFEVIVVEQSPEPRLRGALPEHVVYEHQRIDTPDPFNKSRAVNCGAAIARGAVLAIHDGDFLLPSRYLASCCPLLQEAEGLRPARWIVYFDEATSSEACKAFRIPDRPIVEMIQQNTPNPMLCRRSTYHEIGGHDESFVGWGGEDLEFLSRLRTLRVIEGGFLPVVHLWHPPAEQKANGDRNQSLQEQRLAEAPVERIARLRTAQQRKTK